MPIAQLGFEGRYPVFTWATKPPAAGNVEPSRGEPRYAYQAVATRPATVRPATVRNPSATIAYNNVPVAIRVGFAEGECPTPDYLELIDPTGVAIPFQWEGGSSPVDESSIEFWPDGSLRAGNVWTMATLAAGESKVYAVLCHREARGQSFAPVVVYTAVSGTVDELDTPRMRCRFEGPQGWNLRRYQDKNNASFDLFNVSPGVVASHVRDGIYHESKNGTNVTQVSHGLVASTAFGYGVVYQDYETIFDWVPSPSIRERMRYRVFANGSVKIDRLITNSANIASGANNFLVRLVCGTAGATSTYNATLGRLIINYAGSSFVHSARQRQAQWGATNETFTTIITNPSTEVMEYGISGNPNTALEAGGNYRIGMILAPVSDSGENEWVRTLHPVASFGSVTKPVSDLRDFGRLARMVGAQAIPILESDTSKKWHGALGMVRLMQDGLLAGADAALADYQAWTTARGITPDSATSYYDAWAASTGIEFQGRNTHVLWWLRKAFMDKGDATKQALVESYIHAYADAIVQMEVTSGAGKLQLTASGSDVYNALTGGMAGLAASLNFASNATRQATLDRLSAAYNAASFGGAGLKWSYSPAAEWITTNTIHYYSFQTFELLLAKSHVPSIQLPNGDITALVREAFQPNGMADEWRYNYQLSRRGLAHTHMFAASALALAPTPDYSAAYEILRHLVVDNTIYQQIDGWDKGEPVSPPQDARALAEVVLKHNL